MEQHIKTGILDNLELLQVSASEHQFPLHYHETFCISLIQSGSLGENDTVGSAGSLLISHPFEVHNNYLVCDAKYSMTTLYISSDVFQSLAPAKYLSFASKVVDDPLLYASLQHVAHTILDKDKSGGGCSDEQLLINSLELLLRKYSSAQPFQPEEPSNTDILDNVRQYIQHHSSGKIALERLAFIAGMDKYQFIRWFKKRVGLTPFQFITLKRIEHGKKMIKAGKPLVYAALDAGFYDQSHFSGYFKQFIGLTPGEYQQQCNMLQDRYQ